MIVRQFLSWMRTASSSERAEGAQALARAFLYSDLSPDDSAAAEGALLLLLDDPSPLVRQAMADVFAASHHAPPAIVCALVVDQPDIAHPLLRFSPVLLDTDLVDLVATGTPQTQCAIASRAGLAGSVSAAIAEVACRDACIVLLGNEAAEIATLSLERIVERFGDDATMREVLLMRSDLPVAVRHGLLRQISESMAGFVRGRGWMSDVQAKRVVDDSFARATVALAADAQGAESRRLVKHLRETAQLTPGLLLRALLSGQTVFFEDALIELTGLPMARVAGLVQRGSATAQDALFEQAGLPRSTFAAFREALAAQSELGFAGTAASAVGLKRRMVERVLTRYGETNASEVDPLMNLLRRFATEAAREEARVLCGDLLALEDAPPLALTDGTAFQGEVEDDVEDWTDAAPLEGEAAPSLVPDEADAFEILDRELRAYWSGRTGAATPADGADAAQAYSEASLEDEEAITDLREDDIVANAQSESEFLEDEPLEDEPLEDELYEDELLEDELLEDDFAESEDVAAPRFDDDPPADAPFGDGMAGIVRLARVAATRLEDTDLDDDEDWLDEAPALVPAPPAMEGDLQALNALLDTVPEPEPYRLDLEEDALWFDPEPACDDNEPINEDRPLSADFRVTRADRIAA